MEPDPTSEQASQQTLSHSTSDVKPLSASNAGRKRHFLHRRSFLGHAGIFTATSVVAGVIGSPFSSKPGGNAAQARSIRLFNYDQFSQKAYKVRVQAAQTQLDFGVPPHPTNSDEERYPNKIATDTRGLPHDERGEVNLAAYDSLIKALTTLNPDDYENIILGGTRKLVNPQGGLAISLQGINPAQIAVPPPPTLDSAERSAEAVELYWQALLRDVSLDKFQDNTDDPKVLAAIEDLNKLSAFYGPKQNGQVTPQTLFRGSVTYIDKKVIPPGVLDGPYISQFLLRNIPYDAQFISPLIRTALPGNDFLTNYDEWLNVQNGGSVKSIQYDPTRRYVVTVRDLGELAHVGGALFFGAFLLLTFSAGADPFTNGFGAPLSPTNPYVTSKTQQGSAATFAPAHFQALLYLGLSLAVRASYWQKYYVHRTLRPEAYGGLIYNNLVNKTQYPIDSQVLNSQALAQTFSTFGTYLLPQAYPEAAPFDSAYPGGTATIAGVQATLLKAFFDENFVIPNPVVPDPNDPTKVIPYSGSPLTVGGELNKLATNYTIGRGHGGVHWRSDGAVGLALGEELAISMLTDERLGLNERFDGFTFTKFDGTQITV